MNVKRYIAAVIALFLFLFVFESFIHGVILIDIYNQTPNVWRVQAEMISYLPFNYSVMGLITLWLVFIFTRLFKEGGWKKGLEFGLYFGMLSAIQAAAAYYYLPISSCLAAMWFIFYLIEGLLGGLLIGAIYKK